MSVEVRMRQKIEREIVTCVIQSLLRAELAITVNDGEANVLINSRDQEAILRVMFTTDDDVLFVGGSLLPGGQFSIGTRFVHFIYGNSGNDVIHDHSVSLQELLQPAYDLADTYD